MCLLTTRVENAGLETEGGGLGLPRIKCLVQASEKALRGKP